MDKQVLDIEQMQHLQELGSDTGNASMLYCRLYDEFHDERYILVESKHKFNKEENAIILDGIRNSVIYCKKITPVYTLQDVLELLPTKLGANGKLHITRDIFTNKWTVEYFEGATLGRVFFESENLIDAAYEMLCLLIEKEYIKTDKEEKK